eukprot:m51a1_g3028 xanthine dehydrogenase/oxidase, putative (1187) ;mRNA; f:893905-899128
MNTVNFVLNGKRVSAQADPRMTLNEYLRDIAGLAGTKKSCETGTCSACTVTVSCVDSVTGKLTVTTVEGIVGKNGELHPIQQKIAELNGVQCGFCTPGFVMVMYTLLLNHPKPTMAEIEAAFDGNVCRCTGYRSILDAMKTFAVDVVRGMQHPAEKLLKSVIPDLEELQLPTSAGTMLVPVKNKGASARKAGVLRRAALTASDPLWLTPRSLKELLTAMVSYPGRRVKLVGGNTASGYSRDTDDVEVFVTLARVPELVATNVTETSMRFGAMTTIDGLAGLLSSWNRKFPDSTTCFPEFIRALKNLGNTGIRASGTVGGNLMVAYWDTPFVSDLYALLLCMDALLEITSVDGTQRISIADFPLVNMANKVLVAIEIPFTPAGEVMVARKVGLRHKGALAVVSTAFRFNMHGSGTTEQYMTGKDLSRQSVLNATLDILEHEGNVDTTFARTSYRKSLLTSLFYKAYLSLLPNLPAKLQSAARDFERPVSSGYLSYQSKPEDYPVTYPLPKVDAPLSATGDAVYTKDRAVDGMLHGYVVISTCPAGDIESIDATEALKCPGVVAFLSAEDIPEDRNNCGPVVRDEDVFAIKTVKYYGQAVGVVVADTERHARAAASKVVVKYTNQGEPILTLDDAIAKKSFLDEDVMPSGGPLSRGDVENGFSQSTVVLEGSVTAGSQIHYYMETQTCVAIPDKDDQKLKILTGTQWPSGVQQIVSSVTGIPERNIEIEVKRIGGAFGGKITRATLVCCIASVAALNVGKPVKISLDRYTDTQNSGHRNETRCDYKVGVDGSGVIKALKVRVYQDAGCSYETNPGNIGTFISVVDNAYFLENFYGDGFTCRTNRPAMTAKDIIATGEWDKRKAAVEQFNADNRWVKRGISLVPVKYAIALNGNDFGVLINVFADGSIVVEHSGTEMGQGIDTRIAQIVAHELGSLVKMDDISVVATNTRTIPNAGITAGTTGTAINALAAQKAAKMLYDKMEPARSAMTSDFTWAQLVAKAISMGIDLSVKAWKHLEGGYPNNYFSYGVGIAESQVDVLTGETHILRVDIIYDAGISLNPALDLGQCLGGFVQAMGYYITEEVAYNSQGMMSLWQEYNVPLAQDIPIDFRVALLKDIPNTSPDGAYGSKGVGEQPFTMGCVAFFCVKEAIAAARAELGNKEFFSVNAPLTKDATHLACLVDKSQFCLA